MPVRCPRLHVHLPATLVQALVVAVAATACLLSPGPDPVGSPQPLTVTSPDIRLTAAARATRVRSALRIARNQKGDPYRYGAEGPRRFDCSGLVFFSTHRAGFGSVPRTSSAQARFMRRIARSNMRPGDFVFFTGGSGVYHVGIFVGRSNGRRMIVHAPGSGRRVRTDPIWTTRWFAGTLR